MHIYYGFKIASWALMPFNQGIVRHNKTPAAIEITYHIIPF